MSKGIMMKVNVPEMVGLHWKQLEWIEWMFVREDGKKFLEWTGIGDNTKRELVAIANDREYDKANDSVVLNDFIGLYKEWSRDTGIKWKKGI